MFKRSGLRCSTVLAGLLMFGLVLSGCSGPADGFRTLEQGRLRIDIPEGWEPGDNKPGDFFDISLQDDPKQLDAGFVFVASSEFPDANARLALSQLSIFNSFGAPDEQGGMSKLHSDDHGSMWRWDFTIGDGSHQVVIWAIDDGSLGHVVVAGVVGKGGLDDDLIDTLEHSFELVPIQEG